MLDSHRFRLAVQDVSRALTPDYLVQCQLPITMDRSEPEPDLTVVRGDHHDYRTRHPSGRECRLVIEVADTSLDQDRAKIAIYRSAGVEEYWIININEPSMEQYSFAEEPNFNQPKVLPANTKVSLLASGKDENRGLAPFG